jgi:hypothetical protein
MPTRRASEAGQLYEFPRSDQGTIRFGNIEGVGWINPTRIVTVSDRRKKKNQPDKGLAGKVQSVHIAENASTRIHLGVSDRRAQESSPGFDQGAV